jgi:hypothetical protein
MASEMKMALSKTLAKSEESSARNGVNEGW